MSDAVAIKNESRWLALVMASLIGLAAVFNTAAVRAADDEAAESFISTVADQAIGVLNDKTKSQQERTDAFADIVISHADMEAIAYFTLGQYRRSATPAQLEEFRNLFDGFTRNFYSMRLSEYAGQTLNVTGSQVVNNGKEVIVTSELIQPDGSPTAVNWRLRKDENAEFRLRDLQVVGVWLALEQRSQFTATIANNGGSFDALLKVLRDSVARGETFESLEGDQ